MIKIKKDVKVKDFSKETKEFLVKIGFEENDDIGEMFRDFLQIKGIELNESEVD